MKIEHTGKISRIWPETRSNVQKLTHAVRGRGGGK